MQPCKTERGVIPLARGLSPHVKNAQIIPMASIATTTSHRRISGVSVTSASVLLDSTDSNIMFPLSPIWDRGSLHDSNCRRQTITLKFRLLAVRFTSARIDDECYRDVTPATGTNPELRPSGFFPTEQL